MKEVLDQLDSWNEELLRKRYVDLPFVFPERIAASTRYNVGGNISTLLCFAALEPFHCSGNSVFPIRTYLEINITNQVADIHSYPDRYQKGQADCPFNNI